MSQNLLGSDPLSMLGMAASSNNSVPEPAQPTPSPSTTSTPAIHPLLAASSLRTRPALDAPLAVNRAPTSTPSSSSTPASTAPSSSSTSSSSTSSPSSSMPPPSSSTSSRFGSSGFFASLSNTPARRTLPRQPSSHATATASLLTPSASFSSPSSSAAASAQSLKSHPLIDNPLPRSSPAPSPSAASASSSSSPAIAASSPSSSAPSSILDQPIEPRTPFQPMIHSVAREVSCQLLDDWSARGNIPGEKLVMKIDNVYSLRAESAFPGTLFMTSYAIYFVPLAVSSSASSSSTSSSSSSSASSSPAPSSAAASKPIKLVGGIGQAVVSVPLSTIEQLQIDNPKPVRVRGVVIVATLDMICKDMRTLKFGFISADMCRRAHQCLDLYVFPNKDDYLFAFIYKLAHTPPEIDGWKMYDARREFRRMGVPCREYRITDINQDYALSPSYPALFAVPAKEFVSDQDLAAVINFRSRGRLPVLTWKHPHGLQSIWRCSQPRVGVNQTRCVEDEKLLQAITDLNFNKSLTIFDCRPKINAMGNRLAGKGFENTDFYKNCSLRFMNIENIHVMRESCRRVVAACNRSQHAEPFLQAVTASGWLSHLSQLLQATHSMVSALDRDKSSILSHCSDGWDRTTQLCALTQLCVDPFYRTTEGLFVLIEKDWLSFGHKFHERTGHRDKNSSDEQRAPIFLQWCDAVYQLTRQFPTHFQFNSRLLVVMMNHVFSCRFGTFLANSERKRRAAKVHEKTVSLWTYLMGSPAALNGEFTNPLYAPNGCGMTEEDIPHPSPIPGPGLFGDSAPAPSAHDEHANDTGQASSASASSSDSTSTTSSSSASSPSSDEAQALNNVNEPYGLLDEDGSLASNRGSVLYPSWSLKKLGLWHDYFLRWNHEEAALTALGTQAYMGVPATPLPRPAQDRKTEAAFSYEGGPCYAPFVSSQSLLQRRVHAMAQQTQQTLSALSASQSRVTELEQELKAMQEQLRQAQLQAKQNESDRAQEQPQSQQNNSTNANEPLPAAPESVPSAAPHAEAVASASEAQDSSAAELSSDISVQADSSTDLTLESAPLSQGNDQELEAEPEQKQVEHEQESEQKPTVADQEEHEQPMTLSVEQPASLPEQALSTPVPEQSADLELEQSKSHAQEESKEPLQEPEQDEHSKVEELKDGHVEDAEKSDEESVAEAEKDQAVGELESSAADVSDSVGVTEAFAQDDS